MAARSGITIERLKECSKRLFYANVSSGTGAQSTFVYLSDLPTTRRMETLVARRLALQVPYMSMHHRTDRFAELLNILALINSTLGEAGMDLRDLQRTEVAEVAEPWDIEHQHSSSTFPHKRNPETSEWQEGLAKLSRTNALAMMDVQQQHERGREPLRRGILANRRELRFGIIRDCSGQEDLRRPFRR